MKFEAEDQEFAQIFETPRGFFLNIERSAQFWTYYWRFFRSNDIWEQLELKSEKIIWIYKHTEKARK